MSTDHGEAYLAHIDEPVRPSCIYPYVSWEDGVHCAVDPHDARVFGVAKECWRAYVLACVGMGLAPEVELLEQNCYCTH